MASSSSSSIHKTSFKYDVFLSFRGEDTRTNFVDHLYDALMRQNIETYKDDKNLQRGKRIGKELFEAIEDSRFHVIVFSKNYASSSWCLDELVKIIECQKTQTGQTVYPIFYDVEPTQVRKQSGEFGKAFANHKNDAAAVKWREALVEATSFSGRDLSTTADGHEVEFIKIVVKDISSKLPAVVVDENLIGMRTRVNEVVSIINAFPDEICMIGIWGMGGSGKTTLARAVFDQICNEFEGVSFVENVREVSKPNFSGLKKLQKQVLRDVLNDQGITVTGVLDGKTMMKKKLPGRKVLVVLDDVDHIDQLKALAGEPNWFKPGSKIIITTRDKQVLVAHKVNSIHDVNLLTDEEAICLLSRRAFGTEIPIPGYKELSGKVVSYAAGLPLTITILGSSLCDANEQIWIDTIEELEKIPLDGTLQKLELSYMGLDTNCKAIFLDVACILKGRKEDEAIRALESRGFHAIRGLSVLEKRSLITISGDGFLEMHDHIQEMGRYIVRRLHPDEPNNHSRLWIEEEIKDILANHQGTETTCVDLFVSEMNLETVMKGLAKMEKLRLLYVYVKNIYTDWKIDEVSEYFPNSLQYLNWYRYPFCSLPKTFLASNLVGLEMSFTKMDQLWEGEERKVLHKLRFLRVSGSKLRTFDLGLTPNLEILDLKYCQDLVELRIPIKCLKLRFLNLEDSKLRTIDLTSVQSIETLNVNECRDLVVLDMPSECPQLKSLNLSCPKLRSLNLGLIPNIETLNLVYCDGLVELHMPLECPQLISLNLSCPNLTSFNREPTPNIKTLKLEECAYLVELDMFLQCPQLESLDLGISMLRTLDLRSTPNLETLRLHGSNNLVELRMNDECRKLKTLGLGCPQLRTFNLCLTVNLEALTLDGHDDLVELVLDRCPQLEYLGLINSKLRTLELTLKLKKLILKDCDLLELHIPDGDVKLESLDIKRCSKLKTLDFGRTPNLETLILEECSSLVKLHAPVGGLKKLRNLKAQSFLRFTDLRIINMAVLFPELDLYGNLVDICPLHPYNNFPKFQFGCSYMEPLPSSIGNIEKLISVGFSCACTDLQSFYGSICGLHHLTKLSLEGSVPDAPKDLDRLQSLEELSLKSTKIKCLPDGICMLKHLKILKLIECELLEKLPEDLDRLQSLEKLSLKSTKIKCLPDGICMLKHLKILKLIECELLEKLPEDLDRLQSLEKLSLKSTKIKCLPDGICMLKHLKILKLIECELLEKLPEDLDRLQSLEKLSLKSTKIKCLPDGICMLKHLKILKLIECELLEKLPEDLDRLQSLEKLSLKSTKIKRLPDGICMLKQLHILDLEDCKLLEKLPVDLGRLERLESLVIAGSIILRDIPNSICMMKSLKYFSLRYCMRVEKLPKEIGSLECLEHLDIRGTCINNLPRSILLIEGLHILLSEYERRTCCTML